MIVSYAQNNLMETEMLNNGIVRFPHQTAPDENICPDCADETKLVESDYDDDLEYYEVHACLGDCGGHFDQVGEPIYDGSDYNDRMSERRQMGFLMS